MRPISDEFASSLEWIEFIVPVRPDFPIGVSPRDDTRTPAQERLLEEYYEKIQDWHSRMEILTQAGTVIRLNNGACVLVGHVNESLSANDDNPCIDFDKIEAIAVLW